MLRILAGILCLSFLCQVFLGCASADIEDALPANAILMPVSQQAVGGTDNQADAKPPRTVYVRVNIRSEPTGATVKINDIILGSTPLIVPVPFVEGPYGDPTGSAELILQKPGYKPLTVQLYAIAGRYVSLEPDGKPLGRHYFRLELP